MTHLGTTPSRQSKMLQGDSESYSESEAESEYPWPKQHACAKMLVRSGLRCSSRNGLKRPHMATWQESPSPLGMVQRSATWSCHIYYIYTVLYSTISFHIIISYHSVISCHHNVIIENHRNSFGSLRCAAKDASVISKSIVQRGWQSLDQDIW